MRLHCYCCLHACYVCLLLLSCTSCVPMLVAQCLSRVNVSLLRMQLSNCECRVGHTRGTKAHVIQTWMERLLDIITWLYVACWSDAWVMRCTVIFLSPIPVTVSHRCSGFMAVSGLGSHIKIVTASPADYQAMYILCFVSAVVSKSVCVYRMHVADVLIQQLQQG